MKKVRQRQQIMERNQTKPPTLPPLRELTSSSSPTSFLPPTHLAMSTPAFPKLVAFDLDYTVCALSTLLNPTYQPS